MEILASILGGLTGGLFTFLGVLLTIRNERKIQEENIKKHNIDRNKAIIEKRPEFKVVDTTDKIKAEVEIYALPYICPKLLPYEEIIFSYAHYDLKCRDFWDYIEVILCNGGETAIEISFLQLQYKKEVNIYSQSYMDFFDQSLIKYYFSDMVNLPNLIYPNECIKIKLYYPKEDPKIKNIELNCYMHDINDNYWFQKAVNSNFYTNHSEAVSSDEFRIHFHNNCNRYFIFEWLYNLEFEKCFKLTNNYENNLKEQIAKLVNKEEQFQKFKYKVKNGEELLN